MRVMCLLAALFLSAAEVGAQAAGTIRGHGRSARTGEPIMGATVLIVGTRVGAVADSTGLYLIVDVPAGWATLRARMIGFADSDQVVDVRAGDASVADFMLAESI